MILVTWYCDFSIVLQHRTYDSYECKFRQISHWNTLKSVPILGRSRSISLTGQLYSYFMAKNEMYPNSRLQIVSYSCIFVSGNNWIHGFLQFWKKKCIRIPVFLMYSYLSVQKLKVFGVMKISTSANYLTRLFEHSMGVKSLGWKKLPSLAVSY